MPLPLRRDIRLVPVTRGHAARMSGWVRDPVVADGLGLRDRNPSMDKTLAWIDRAVADPLVRAFAVEADGEHVGTVVLDRIDDYLGTARLSVYVGEPAARGTGVGRTAVMLAARFAFDDLDLHKICLTVHHGNARAIAAYAAVGFRVEGVHRDEFILGGERVPVLYMGLLRSEWPGLEDGP